MSCDQVVESIPLYHYGELTPEEEERFEQHVDACPACRGELERHRRLAAALDRRELHPPAGMLAECRHDLMRAIYGEIAAAPRSPWASFRDGFAGLFASFARYRQPVGAVALLALGYFSARLTAPARPAPETAVPASDVVYSSVRSVQPDTAGRVQISLDETRRRIVSGKLEDGNIRRLLLAAAREEDNPAVRVESVGILKDHSASEEVRRALLNVAVTDPNAGVRLKAIEGLKPFASEPQVRKTLAQVLLTDSNPGVRIRTIDMLTEQPDDSMVGVLQNLVQKENNSYVRQKCERALKDLNASIGTF
jgi:hypothetical protein